ncbi:hypothetical protein [Brevundimonas sp. TWP2-3-4b1]|uniref:hypothetical protein n=1 Tax=Brevundimonas sp. TWP2-3-4b1 TaxID=2804580 RepID=UPI003CEB6B73
MVHHVITREALYERVWAQPVRTVALELGVSDVGLGKACRSAGIPTPPRGFWTRIHHRKPPPPRPPLEARPDQRDWVVIAPARSRVRVSPLPSATFHPPLDGLDLASLVVSPVERIPDWPVPAPVRGPVFAGRPRRPWGD